MASTYTVLSYKDSRIHILFTHNRIDPDAVSGIYEQISSADLART